MSRGKVVEIGVEKWNFKKGIKVYHVQVQNLYGGCDYMYVKGAIKSN